MSADGVRVEVVEAEGVRSVLQGAWNSINVYVKIVIVTLDIVLKLLYIAVSVPLGIIAAWHRPVPDHDQTDSLITLVPFLHAFIKYLSIPFLLGCAFLMVFDGFATAMVGLMLLSSFTFASLFSSALNRRYTLYWLMTTLVLTVAIALNEIYFHL